MEDTNTTQFLDQNGNGNCIEPTPNGTKTNKEINSYDFNKDVNKYKNNFEEKIINKKNILTYDNVIGMMSPKYNGGTLDTCQPFEIYETNGLLNEEEKIIHANQLEKRLQGLTNRQFEILLNKEIDEEGIFNEVDLSKQNGNGYILVDELRKHIIKYNDNKHLQDKLDQNNISLSKNEVLEKMLQDLLDKYNQITKRKEKNKNKLIHELFFNQSTEIINLQRIVSIEGVDFSYELFDFKNPRTNEITIIKEKKLLTFSNDFEYSDFCVYLNGLPFIVVEMKSQEESVYKALNDYSIKTSYHNFMACVGTNGLTTFLSSNPNYNDYFEYQNYERLEEYRNEYVDSGSGLFDISLELLTNPKNLLKYFGVTSMLSEDEHINDQYLKTARVQQYNTVDKIDNIWQKKDSKQPVYIHFVHHTRTGKSYTFKCITNLMYQNQDKYGENRVNKIIFYTHDVASVLPSIKKEFYNLEVPGVGKGKTINVINSKKDYREKLATNKGFAIYVVNMQKIDVELDEDGKVEVLDDSNNVLILIDEVHTHQGTNDKTNKIEEMTQADKRRLQFPNASIIAATASPIFKEKKSKDKEGNEVKELVDITETLYGKCIDKLSPTNALDLGLVTPLHYEKTTYKKTSNQFSNIALQLEQKQKEEVIKELLETNEIDTIKNKIIREAKHKINNLNGSVINLFNKLIITEQNYDNLVGNDNINNINKSTKDYQDFEELLITLQNTLSERHNKIEGYLKKVFKKELWKKQLPLKLRTQVIPKIKSLRRSILGEGTIEQNRYMPKSYYVLSKRNPGDPEAFFEAFIIVLREEIQKEIDILTTKGIEVNPMEWSIENNIFDGVRFGVDTEDTQEDNKPITNVSNINGDLGRFKNTKDGVTSLFEVDDLREDIKNEVKTKPIDVLVLVRKKLMGYDNKELTMVFLDTVIKDVKMMLQLATRGTTKRSGKESGYMIDLTFEDTQNIETWESTLKLYDRKDNSEVFIHDFEEHKETIKELEKEMDILKSVKIDHLISNNIQIVNNDTTKKDLLNNTSVDNCIKILTNTIIRDYWNIENSLSSKTFLTTYFEQFNKISKLLKDLVSPTYVLNQLNKLELYSEYLVLLFINSELLRDIKNKKIKLDNFISKQQIVSILDEIFKQFGGLDIFTRDISNNISSKIKDNIKIEVKNPKQIKLNSMKNKKIDIEKLINKLTSSKNTELFEELQKIDLLISQEAEPLEDTENLINDLEEKTKQILEETQRQIEEVFEGSELRHEIYNQLKELFELHIEEEELLHKVLLQYSKEIETLLLEDKKTRVKEDNLMVLIKKIFDKLGFTNLNVLKPLDTIIKKEGSKLNVYKTIGKDLLKIRENMNNSLENKVEETLIQNSIYQIILKYLKIYNII